MTRARSYYDLLGVSRTATADEIRRAYLRLMKQHHPDSPDRNLQKKDLAAVLNRCYAVLKDPDKRAQYDSKLAPAVPARTVRLPKIASRRRRVGTPTTLSVAMLLVGLALIGLTLLVQRSAQDSPAAHAWWGFPSPAAQPPASLDQPLPSSAAAQELVELAQTTSDREAEQLSRECFATARSEQGSSDRCILFDVVFLFWRKPPSTVVSFPTYFADELVAARHENAVAELGPQGQKRLLELREAGFRASVERITGVRPEAPRSSLPRSAAEPGVEEGEKSRMGEVESQIETVDGTRN